MNTDKKLQARLAAAKEAETTAGATLETERNRVRVCEEEDAGLDAQLGGLDVTAAEFDALALAIVQQRDVKRAKLAGLQERTKQAEDKLAEARQAVQDAEEAIRVARHEQLDVRAGELDQKIQDGLKTWEAELRVVFAELRQNRIARNGPNGAWGAGSRWVDVAPPDHPSLFPKALDRWLVNGKPGTTREQDKGAA